MKLNSQLMLRTGTVRIGDENAVEWATGHDVIMDALDNHALPVTRSIGPLMRPGPLLSDARHRPRGR
jgi:hypothetical protein